jgi:hypothetical protein
MKVPWFETVDAGVMRVVSTVVMNIDAGEWPFAASDFEHFPQKCCGRGIRTRGARPCSVEVFLVRQRAHVGLRSLNVADEQQKGALRLCSTRSA